MVGMLLSEVWAMASELYPDIYEDIFPLANIKWHEFFLNLMIITSSHLHSLTNLISWLKVLFQKATKTSFTSGGLMRTTFRPGVMGN